MSHIDLLDPGLTVDVQRELSKELDIQLRSRTEVDNNQNMNMHEMLDENGRLREANSRLTNSYSKLKTDYTQIVDDLRTLKHKYNNFKVEHAKTNKGRGRNLNSNPKLQPELYCQQVASSF